MTPSGDLLYFVARAPGLGFELYRTDGTAQGTALIRNIGPGNADGDPYALVDVDGTLLFNVRSWDEGVWKSDGTTQRTVKLSGWDIGGPHWMGDPIVIKDVAYYYFGDGIYYTDGTPEGSGKVAGTGQPAGFFGPNFQLDGHGTLFFQFGDVAHGAELWMIPAAKHPEKPKDFAIDTSAPPAGAAPLPGAPASAPVTLTWTPGNDMNGYRIQRSTSPNFETIDAAWPVNANFDRFTDATATPGARHYYRLIAYNPAGESEPATIVIDPPPPPLPGDANGDGAVNFQDLVAVVQNYNRQGTTLGTGDVNGDGRTDFTDLVILAQHYGTPTAAVAQAPAAVSPTDKKRASPPRREPAVFSTAPVARPKPPRRS